MQDMTHGRFEMPTVSTMSHYVSLSVYQYEVVDFRHVVGCGSRLLGKASQKPISDYI